MSSSSDRQLLLVAGNVAAQVGEQMIAQGADAEELWIALALAARVAERAVIEADRSCNDLRAYASAQSRLKHLISISDRASEAVEADMAREDGAPDVIRS